MKNFFNKFKYVIFGALLTLGITVYAVNVTVPSSPGKGYMLQGLSSGNWQASSTATAYFGNYVATSTRTNVLTNSSISSLVNLTSNGLVFTAGSNGTLNTVATSTLTGTGLISVTAGAYVPGATPIVVSCSTCGAGTVTAVTGTWPIISSGGNTPNITFGGLGTTTNSGIGNDLILYTSHTGVILGVASSSLSLPNTALQNSTISGISLGGTLASHSHDTSFTGTTYNGSATVSDWGLDLNHTNTWTVLQNFNYSSSTIYSSFITASSTFYQGAGLSTCNGSNFLQWSGGTFGCATVSGSGTVSSGGPNMLAFYSANGTTIVATSSNPLYLDAFNATSTTATSTVKNALRLGATAAARDNMLQVDCSGRTWPASISVGGCVSIDGGTVNQGTLLFVHENTAAVGTGRMVNFIQDNTTVTQDMWLASSSCANCTALNVKGFPTGKGLLKMELTGGGTGFANSSLISGDRLACIDCQGIFLDTTLASSTGKVIQIKNNGINVFDFLSDAQLGIASSSPYAALSVKSFAAGTTTAAFWPYPSQTADVLHVGNTNNTVSLRVQAGGFGTTTLSGLNISGSATSTSNVGYNITTGCFAISGTCISGSGGSGTVTNIATNNGLTGGPITTTGTIGLDITSLSTNAAVAWNGSKLVATGTPQFTAGNFLATSTTATSTFMGNVLITPTGDSNYGFQSFQPFEVVGNANNPFQIDVINRSTGAQALSSIFLGNDKTTNSGFTSTYYGGITCAGSNYNTPGANAVRPNGCATFASDGPFSLGSAATNPASSTVFFQAGSGLDVSYDMALMGGNGNLVIGTTTLRTVNGIASYALSTAFNNAKLWISSSTIPQIALEGGDADPIWNMRNAGGILYFATSSPTTYATTSTFAISIDSAGFGTTTINVPLKMTTNSNTFRAVNITSQGTQGFFITHTGSGHGFASDYNNAAGLGSAGNFTSNATGASAVQITGAETTLASLKITHTGTAGVNASIANFSSNNAGYLGQGFFMDVFMAADTQKIMNLRGNSVEQFTLLGNGRAGLGVVAPGFQLQISSSTASNTFRPQLALSDSNAATDFKHWTLASEGGLFYISTSTDAFATSSVAALTIDKNGKVRANCFTTDGTTCLSGTGGSGTVTSVTAATPNSTLTLGGTNPVTTSGTINFDINLGHTNTWTVLQNFNYSSSTIYSSFLTASSTFYQGAGLATCNSGSFIQWAGGTFGCAKPVFSVDVPIVCNAGKTSNADFAPGGSYYAPINATANNMDIGGWTFTSATSSEVSCIARIPQDLAGTPNAVMKLTFVGTTTSAKKGAIDIDVVQVDPTSDSYDPAVASFINLSAGSTTASNLITTQTTAWLATSTNISFTSPALTAGKDLLVRVRRYGADADDTILGDMIMVQQVLKVDVNTR